MPAETDDSHRTDYVVVPSVTTFLNSEQVVFLLVVEHVLGTGVARNVLHKGRFDVPVLKSVMLVIVRLDWVEKLVV